MRAKPPVSVFLVLLQVVEHVLCGEASEPTAGVDGELDGAVGAKQERGRLQVLLCLIDIAADELAGLFGIELTHYRESKPQILDHLPGLIDRVDAAGDDPGVLCFDFVQAILKASQLLAARPSPVPAIEDDGRVAAAHVVGKREINPARGLRFDGRE